MPVALKRTCKSASMTAAASRARPTTTPRVSTSTAKSKLHPSAVENLATTRDPLPVGTRITCASLQA
eukprot:9107670-Alexandrium_andersonii.AAC.1